MKNTGFNSILAVAVSIFILILAGLAFAAPMPQLMIVNNDSMHCARFLPGDECTDCKPPAGWKLLASGASCPENYTLVTVKGICSGFENQRCCTEKHSGAPGDCRNLVKSDMTQECALVEDATNCTLPVGWFKMPENNSSSKWMCPFDYSWTTISCSA